MKKLPTLLLLIAAIIANGQVMINKGGAIYLQKGSLMEVQGDFINGDNSAGSINNDGIIELQGNFENLPNATFQAYNDSTSTDRAVKFTGSGTQTISGSMGTPGTAAFYNLVIDKTSPGGIVMLDSNVAVQGSLVFGSATTTTTYNPGSLYTNNNQKGLIQTYIDSTHEYLLNVVNGNTDAIAGYPAMVIDSAPTTGYVLTSGTRGSNNGGLQRKIAGTTSYDFPIGTVAHGFNAVRMNFTDLPTGGGLVKGKFNDGSDNPNGIVGYLGTECIGCSGLSSSPDNSGYNRFFTSNPCNDNSPQWFILDDAITNHGYWSLASADSNQNYNYSIEVFPNSYTMLGNITDTWRTIKYPGGYGLNPSASTFNWTPFIDTVAAIDDLLEYSLNTGTCYTGNGVPGGSYSGFGQFTMKKSNVDDALPVKLLSLTAAAQSQNILVNWSTAVEINNNGFSVQRSTDGISFDNIGWVAGHDNSTVTEYYSYTDNNATPGTVYYYRLNQIDNNGNGTLSNTAAAEITGVTAFTVSEPMPNPANISSKIMVYSSVSQNVDVKIYDMTGQLVAHQTYTITAGNNGLSLNVQNLASGTYSTIVEAVGETFSKMLIVSR